MKLFLLLLFVFFLIDCQSQKKIQKSDDHHKIAISLLQTCDKKRALSHLIKAVDYDPKNFILRHTLAVNYYSLAQYEKALNEFKKSLELEPKLTEAVLGIANTFIKLNQLEQAQSYLEKAEKDLTYTGQLRLITTAGFLEYEKGNYLQSQKKFREVLSIPQGKTCENYIKLGQTQIYLNSLSSAEKNLKKAFVECKKLEKNPCATLNHEHYFAMAQLRIKKNQIKQARYFLKLFLKKNRSDTKKRQQARKLLESLQSSKK